MKNNTSSTYCASLMVKNIIMFIFYYNPFFKNANEAAKVCIWFLPLDMYLAQNQKHKCQIVNFNKYNKKES